MKNFFVIIVSIVFSIIICELLLRYVFINDHLRLRVEANQKQFKDFQQLTWDVNLLSFIPESTGQVNHPEYSYKIQHDKIGFRNPCVADRAKKLKNIIVGDSFVYGVGVNDENSLNCKINLDNYTMGVPNSSVKCYSQLIAKHYSRLKKNFNLNNSINIHVIIYMGNDFEDLVEYEKSDRCPNNYINYVGDNRNGFKNRLNHSLTKGLLSKYYLPQIQKILYKNFQNKKMYKNFNSNNKKYFIDNGNDSFYTNADFIDKVKLKKSLRIIIKDFIKIDYENFNVLFYLMPSGSDISKERLIRKAKISGFDYKLIDTNLKYLSVINVCNELKIKCYDLRKFFLDKDFYYHDTHLNSEGVKTLSKIISKNIKNN